MNGTMRKYFSSVKCITMAQKHTAKYLTRSPVSGQIPPLARVPAITAIPWATTTGIILKERHALGYTYVVKKSEYLRTPFFGSTKLVTKGHCTELNFSIYRQRSYTPFM